MYTSSYFNRRNQFSVIKLTKHVSSRPFITLPGSTNIGVITLGTGYIMADMNFLRKWLMRRLAAAEQIAAQESHYQPSLQLELPALDTQGASPRYGFWSAIVFLSLLFSPAWGAAVGYFVFANLYDGSRAKALGVAAGITFTPAIVYLAIMVFGGLLILSRRD